MPREYIELRVTPAYNATSAMLHTGSTATAQELVDAKAEWSLLDSSVRGTVVTLNGKVDGESLCPKEEAMWLLSNGWVMSNGGHIYGGVDTAESYLMYRKT